MSRTTSFFAAAALATLAAGCTGGPHSNFTPLSSAPSLLLREAAVKETILHSFLDGATDGETPSGLLKVGNLLYGTSFSGGRYDKGTVFSMSPDGTNFTVLHSFKGKQTGSVSPAGLTNVGGTMYGTTKAGGTNGEGTVFSITTTGAFTTLYSFKGGKRDGAAPSAPLTNVLGTLYGTTASGGDVGSGACVNCGTVFSISTSGQEKVRYFFGSKKDDGSSPGSKLVSLGGRLYGTTSNGGIGGVTGNGTIFTVTTGGKETVLYRFKNDLDGSCASNCYLMNFGGTLYGTAYGGGKNNVGSVFSITTGGKFKTLYSASGKGRAGGNPDAALTNVRGTLYGTMSEGPIGKRGTVFSITTSGALTTLYTFTGSDGAKPSTALILVGKTLFGTTAKGGSKDLGTIYSISGF
jgi:uncharacterized repeat protein (TIGR03803 family)